MGSFGQECGPLSGPDLDNRTRLIVYRAFWPDCASSTIRTAAHGEPIFNTSSPRGRTNDAPAVSVADGVDALAALVSRAAMDFDCGRRCCGS
jgi:hypothetical protein